LPDCTFLNFNLDCFLSGNNFQRLRKMLIQARWDEMRQKMQVVKNAYVSRHYTQCAKYGERLLVEVQGEVSTMFITIYCTWTCANKHAQIHPIHLAYLNFYIALSHDTLAREATLKNRYKELSLAEKHYSAAIAALTPSSRPFRSNDHQHPSSPASSTSSSEEIIWKFRHPSNANSIDSTNSVSSSTSYSDSRPDLDYTHRGLGRFNFPLPPQSPKTYHSHKHSTGSVIIPSRPETPEEYQFAADTAAFIRMVRDHLSNVRDLKKQTSVPAVRFTFPSPLPSPKSRMTSRVFDDEAGREAMDMVRRERMTRKWRPRFDPEEVQRLCGEALAELAY
jgi:hypothetical protein